MAAPLAPALETEHAVTPALPRLQKGSEAVSSRAADLNLNRFSADLVGNGQAVFHQCLDINFDGLLDVGHRFLFVGALRHATLESRAVCHVAGYTTFFDYDRILQREFSREEAELGAT